MLVSKRCFDSPESSEDLEVDGLENLLRCVEFDEEHDEDAVVRELLELCVANLMVLQQHPGHYAQYLRRNNPVTHKTFHRQRSAGLITSDSTNRELSQ